MSSDDVFQHSVRREFAFLKSTGAIADLHARSIVIRDDLGLLVPVCELHRDDARAAELLGAAARDRTLDDPDRILFLLCDRHGHAAGHLGLAPRTAAGNTGRELVVETVAGEPQLLRAAADALCDWAHALFGPDEICAPPNLAPPTRDASRPLLTAGPSISGREPSYALDAVRTGWNDHHSDYLDRFSTAFADYVGVRHALPTSSCTGALHLSLLACGIGPGDEVVVPDLTWVATANAVAYTGATPVFADVQERGWCLDPAAFEAAVTPRTKAVMPVHLYGHPAQMDEICRIAHEHGLRIVEDAAPSIGAETAGRRTGSFGDAGCFSFQGAKLVVTGEGGMLVTDDDDLYERARYLWGLCHEGDFWIGETGWKYRMSNVQAAVGLGQIERVDALIDAKRRVFGWYAEELDGVPGLELSHGAPFGRSIHWMTSVRVLAEAGVTRDELRDALRRAGIDTRPVFPAISRYPVWTRRQLPGPVADRIGRQGINLPSGVCLRREDVRRVARAIRATLASNESRAA
jgi:perosamine synthetase